jgi:acyl carrier protein
MASAIAGCDMNDRVAGMPRKSAIPQEEIAALIVAVLNLEIAPTEIQPDEPLFGDGLGLDSIDALELALEISRRYGIEIKADGEETPRIFSSLRALTEFINEATQSR